MRDCCFVFVFFVFSWCFRDSAEVSICVKYPHSSCRCTADDGSTFDLSPVASSDPSQPRFTKFAVIGFLEETFEYNPCYGIPCEPMQSNDSAVCNKFEGGLGVSGGTQKNAQFQFDSDGNLQILYTTHNDYFSSVITFICSQEEGNGTFDMQNGPSGYEGTLSSRYACFTPGPHRLSTFDIFIISVFPFFIVYFVFAAVFQACTRRRGSQRTVPICCCCSREAEEGIQREENRVVLSALHRSSDYSCHSV